MDSVDHQENPVVPVAALQVHGGPEKQRRELLMPKNELSDIHLLIGDVTTTGCGINYARIQKKYAPKHEMSKFCPNFKRLIESKRK